MKHKPLILIVEDEPDMQDLIRETLVKKEEYELLLPIMVVMLLKLLKGTSDSLALPKTVLNVLF